MSLSRSLSSRSSYKSVEDSLSRPRSNLGVRSEGMSDSASQEIKTQHKHNDYSCYIHVINRTETSLQLIDSKSISGHWANGTPPQKIGPDTDTLIELTDPKGPSGSEGWCAYKLQHPERSTPVTFKLKFYDPYWTGHDNYLKASTRHPGLVSLNVLKYQTRGHPFIAYVEVKTLKSNNARNPQTPKRNKNSTTDTKSDDGTLSVESPSESLPSYESRPSTASISVKEPILTVEPVEIGDSHDHPTDQDKSTIIITVDEDESDKSCNSDDDTSQDEEKEVAESEKQDDATADSQVAQEPEIDTSGEQNPGKGPEKTGEEHTEVEMVQQERESKELGQQVDTTPVEAVGLDEVDGKTEEDTTDHDAKGEEYHEDSVRCVQPLDQHIEAPVREQDQYSILRPNRESSEIQREVSVEEPLVTHRLLPVEEEAAVIEAPVQMSEPKIGQESEPKSAPAQELTLPSIDDDTTAELHTAHPPVSTESSGEQVPRAIPEQEGLDDDDLLSTSKPGPTAESRPIYTDSQTQTDFQLYDPSSQKPSQEPSSSPELDLETDLEPDHDPVKTVVDSVISPHAKREAHAPTIVQKAYTLCSNVTTTVFKSRHGQIGIISLVFLTSYGVTAAKVSRGLLTGGRR